MVSLSPFFADLDLEKMGVRMCTPEVAFAHPLDGGRVAELGTHTTLLAGGGVYADPSGQPVVLIGTEVKRNKGGNTSGRVIRI